MNSPQLEAASLDPYALSEEYFAWRRSLELPLPLFAASLRIRRSTAGGPGQAKGKSGLFSPTSPHRPHDRACEGSPPEQG